MSQATKERRPSQGRRSPLGGSTPLPWMVGIALLGIAGVVIQSASASGTGMGEEAPPAASQVVAPDSLSILEERIRVLEARVGLRPQEDSAKELFRERYLDLMEREMRVAAAADSMLEYVPGINPVVGGVVSSAYSKNRFHPILKRTMEHHGIDIKAPEGTPVLAAATGTVLRRFRSPQYGLGVDLDHGNGYITRYVHLSKIEVSRGSAVRRGDLIARVGATGLATGPVLHYEVYYQRKARDPGLFLPGTTDLE